MPCLPKNSHLKTNLKCAHLKQNIIKMKTLILTLFCLFNNNFLFAQTTLVGGACEGCEAVLEYLNKPLTSVDTLPDFNRSGPKLKLQGTVYQQDGKTPAANVVIYSYHTNQNGVYEKQGNEKGLGKVHGHLRGWVKTGADGQYTFYTLKPGTYPNRSEPAHVHLTVLEPNGKYYWITSAFFEGDPLLSAKELSNKTPRGGGDVILELKTINGMLVGRRDIILGKNLEGYN